MNGFADEYYCLVLQHSSRSNIQYLAKQSVRSAGYAFPPLGVPADLQSAVKKCPNLFMLWGYVIPSPRH